MNQKEKNRLKEHYKGICKFANVDEQDFDIEKEIDYGLTYEEALTELQEKLKHLIPTDLEQLETKGKYLEEKHKFDKREKEARENLRKELGMFQEQANVLVMGKKRSGKTCLSFLFLKEFGNYNRKMYIYRHPNPEILNELPFKVYNLTNLKQISNLTNAVILIDESDKVFPVMEKTVNSQLRNILSLSGQNNLCFIFVCHNGYFINRSLFSFIDIKIIKEVNEGHWELERAHMKKLYSDYPVMGNNNFFIDSDYYRGMETFEKPDWFTEKLSFAYKNEISKDFFTKMRDAR